MNEALKELKEEFIAVSMEAINVRNHEAQSLLHYLEFETDFFTAPASTRYHGACEGGLVAHSLNVYESLLFEYENEGITVDKGMKESIAIVALFHDLCKINTYEATIVNVPPNKTKSGKWEQQQGYIKKEKMHLGHGAKSLSVLQDFMPLSQQEKEAIYWHMSSWDLGTYSTMNDLSETYERNTLAVLLHIADMKSTYIVENIKEG